MSYVVVTGAARGIGLATAKRFFERGLAVVMLNKPSSLAPALLGEGIVVESLGLLGAGKGVVLSCDLESPPAIEAACASMLNELGPPRAVVHNAGVVARSPVESTSLSTFSHVMAVNLTGPFVLTKALLPSMRRAATGRFVFVSSISARLGTANLSAYCASKWAITGFMKSLAEELRASGLQALAVLPGSVDTDMLKGSGFPPAMAPDDVARVLVHAALDAPDAMNGSAIEMFG